MFFNRVGGRLAEMRSMQNIPPGSHHDYIFADDVTTVIVADTKDATRIFSKQNIVNVRKTLGEQHLNLQEPKSHNILMQPAQLPQGVYRRGPPISLLSTKTRQRRQYQHDASYDHTLLEFDPQTQPSLTTRAEMDSDGFPYPLEESIKILGIRIDDHFSMDAGVEDLLARSQLRQGILAKLARTTWGLETSVLRITHDALISSILRYGLTIVGSCCPDDLANRIDVAIINVAARRVSGLPLSTRIEVLHFISGTHSYRNLYVQHCAVFLHQCLQGHDSQIRYRLVQELQETYQTTRLEPEAQQIPFDIGETFVSDCSGIPVHLLQNTKWMGNFYVKPLNYEHIAAVPSTYVAHAAELKRSAAHRESTYTFAQTYSWLDVALQVLTQGGWRPECSRPQTPNIQRMVPPNEHLAHFYTDRELSQMDEYITREGNQILTSRIGITSGVVRADEVLPTIATLAKNGRERFTSGFVHGRHTGDELPAFMQEASVLHALRTLKEWMQGADQTLVQHVSIRAGSALAHYQIERLMQGKRLRAHFPSSPGNSS